MAQIDHDRLFKELLESFFAEFLALFFPEAHAAVDLSHLRFLQQEVFTDVTAGEKHVVDILAETKLKGEEGLILVHVENQARIQPDFTERMFIYFSRLYQKFRRRILPIAVFSYDQAYEEPDLLRLGFPFLDVLQFRFYKLELKKRHWRDYIQSDNPVAAALLSKMGYRPEEKVRVKIEFLRMLARMRLDPARMTLLAGFFETYLKLTQAEEEEFLEELQTLAPAEVAKMMEITTSWHEKGRAEGLAEGRAEGLVEGQIALVLRLARKRFGQVPAELEQALRSLSREQIEALGEALLDAKNLDELRAMMH
ncbi:MAG: DUF4351 domain-containing protein [Firmicutes bacterium]|nr:DUF4351 domain-containing protein [Bacillota bacterium]